MEARARVINQSYVQTQMKGMAPEAVAANWPTVRATFAKQTLGLDNPNLTDRELHGVIGNKLKENGEQQSLLAYAHQEFSKPFRELPAAPKNLPNMPWLGTMNPALIGGVYDALKPLAEGLETPESIATLGVGAELKAVAETSKIARVALAGMGGVFAGIMGSAAVRDSKEVGRVMMDPNSNFQDKVTAVGKPVADVMAAILSAFGAVTELMPKAEVPPLLAKMDGANPAEAAAVLREEAQMKADSSISEYQDHTKKEAEQSPFVAGVAGQLSPQNPASDALKIAADKLDSIATPEQKSAQIATAIEKTQDEGGSHPSVGRAAAVWKSIKATTGPVIRSIGREVFPRTTHASIPAANQLARLASVREIGAAATDASAYAVMGDNLRSPEFNQNLAAVIIQDMRYATRERFAATGKDAAAAAVKDIMSPEDFQKLVSDPQIKKAIAAHKRTVQPAAQEMHEEAGGQLRVPGKFTGAFLNELQPLEEGAEAGPPSGAGGDPLARQLKKSSAFTEHYSGTSEKPLLDYRENIRQMINRNLPGFEWRKTIDTLESEGLAKVTKAGDEPVWEIGGKPTVKMLIQRQPQGPSENLYVRADLADEVKAANGERGNMDPNVIAKALTKAQLIGLGPVNIDSVTHIANMLSSLSGSERGNMLLHELAVKLPGVNIASALAAIHAKAVRVMVDDPALYADIQKLAEVGAWRAHQAAEPGIVARGITSGLGKLGVPQESTAAVLAHPLINSKAAISVTDRAARLVAKDIYDEAVKRGLFDDSDRGLRNFVNQLGVYNPKMMGSVELAFKQLGLSPFVVAGKQFNLNALRRLTGAPVPGVATNNQAMAKIMATNIAGTIATLMIPSILNYSRTRKVVPGNIPFGSLYLYTREDGSIAYLDPAQWIGLRRGLRITGAQAMMNDALSGKSPTATGKDAVSDIIMGQVHPFAGPAVNTAVTAAVGQTPYAILHGWHPKGGAGPSLESIKAAAYSLNPIEQKTVEGGKSGKSPVKTIVEGIAGAGGLKFKTPRGKRNPYTLRQQ